MKTMDMKKLVKTYEVQVGEILDFLRKYKRSTKVEEIPLREFLEEMSKPQNRQKWQREKKDVRKK